MLISTTHTSILKIYFNVLQNDIAREKARELAFILGRLVS